MAGLPSDFVRRDRFGEADAEWREDADDDPVGLGEAFYQHTLSRLVQEAFGRMGATAGDLALALGVDRTTIERKLNGRKRLAPHDAVAWALVLGPAVLPPAPTIKADLVPEAYRPRFVDQPNGPALPRLRPVGHAIDWDGLVRGLHTFLDRADADGQRAFVDDAVLAFTVAAGLREAGATAGSVHPAGDEISAKPSLTVGLPPHTVITLVRLHATPVGTPEGVSLLRSLARAIAEIAAGEEANRVLLLMATTEVLSILGQLTPRLASAGDVDKEWEIPLERVGRLFEGVDVAVAADLSGRRVASFTSPGSQWLVAAHLLNKPSPAL